MDDEAGNRQAFEATFRKEFKVLCAANLNELLAHLEKNEVHVLIADQRMPNATGAEILTMIRHQCPRIRRMLVTGYADLEAVVEAMNNGGACFYIQKPWEAEPIRRAVLRAVAEIEADDRQIAFTERLLTSNQQLESALRMRLLS
jgi:DNA-binding NtrC family response regulator